MTNIIGIDCGLQGGIAIIREKSIEVHSIPTRKIIVNNHKKTTYDIDEILKLFSEFKNKDVIFCIEKQAIRPGESGTSALTIGTNYGLLLGMAYAFGFKLNEVYPQTWKKDYPDLNNFTEIINLRDKNKIFQETLKKQTDKKLKKETKKEIDKNKRDIKKLAKEAARKLSSKLFPELSDEFKRTKDDGRAESCLIAKYAEKHFV